MIVLIDDEPFALKLLGRQLAQLGCTDHVAYTDAGEALAFIEARFDEVGMVICDLQMPEMDGVEVIRHLAHMRYAGGVVLLSGEEDRILQTAERLGRAHGLRMTSALGKPVSLAHLRDALEHLAKPPAAARGPGRKVYGPEEIAGAIARSELINHY